MHRHLVFSFSSQIHHVDAHQRRTKERVFEIYENQLQRFVWRFHK